MTTQAVLKVFFDGAFWRALVERRSEGLLSIANHIFGDEPSEAEVYRWWISSSASLEFTPLLPVAEDGSERSRGRKKKLQQATKEIRISPISREIRVAAQAARNRRRISARAANKLQCLDLQVEKREKRMQKVREKKKGH